MKNLKLYKILTVTTFSWSVLSVVVHLVMVLTVMVGSSLAIIISAQAENVPTAHYYKYTDLEINKNNRVLSSLTRDIPWRTASWNICTTSSARPSDPPICRAKINPNDATQTAVEVERLAIGKMLLQRDMYSFALQEVCERDVRWIAAYVANKANIVSGGTFTQEQYAAIDSRAPYAFLPYLTSEIQGNRDDGCGPGVSTGVGVIVKNSAGVPPPRIHGLSNANYEERSYISFSYEELKNRACEYYFEAQADRVNFKGERQFRSKGCSSAEKLDTLRGLACVQTSWHANQWASPQSAASCVTHAVRRRDNPDLTQIANEQIIAAGQEAQMFAGDLAFMLAGDFNTSSQAQILGEPVPSLRKLTEGYTHRFLCKSKIDAIYGRGWNFSSPGYTDCERVDMAFPDELGFGDFDGDGITDVFHRRYDGQWRYSSGGVLGWVYLNRSGAPIDELDFGDFNGDGITDVFHRNTDGQWRYSSGGVSDWINLNRSQAPGYELHFGDFDADGNTDVFHRDADGQWRYSSGGVSDWINLNRSQAPGDELRFGDFDADGNTDVFHRDANGQWRYSSGGISNWINLNHSGAPGDELGFGDFNGDGKTDVFYSDTGVSPNQWKYSSGGVDNWVELARSNIPFENLRFHNFDSYSATDVFTANGFGVWAYSGGGAVSWKYIYGGIAPLDLNDPFSWSDHVMIQSALLVPAPRTKSDFDGDGLTDVFHRRYDGQWRYSSGAAERWTDVNRSQVPWYELDVGDLNGDGKADVFHRDMEGQWRYSASGISNWINLNRSQAPGSELDFGDFDGDGKTDVFHRDADGQWRYSSGGVDAWKNLNRSAVSGNELDFGDFDGDGKTDVFHRRSDGQWRFSSGGVDAWKNLNRSAVPGGELDFGDFDGDGKTDIFHRSSDGQWRYSSAGMGAWENLNRSVVPGHELDFGDFDGDGITDVFHQRSDGQWRYSSGGVDPWKDVEKSAVPGYELIFEP